MIAKAIHEAIRALFVDLTGLTAADAEATWPSSAAAATAAKGSVPRAQCTRTRVKGATIAVRMHFVAERHGDVSADVPVYAALRARQAAMVSSRRAMPTGLARYAAQGGGARSPLPDVTTTGTPAR